MLDEDDDVRVLELELVEEIEGRVVVVDNEANDELWHQGETISHSSFTDSEETYK